MGFGRRTSMADVTVKQLAADVGAPVDRLLRQIVEAGLKARSEADSVTSDEKQQLLTYLKKNHGESEAEPKKITLKRKTTTTLKRAVPKRSMLRFASAVRISSALSWSRKRRSRKKLP